MKAITIRSLPPTVARAVREKARKEKLSLNRAVIQLLEQATGTRPKLGPVLHHDLDHLAGTWSETDYRESTLALREQRQIDPEM